MGETEVSEKEPLKVLGRLNVIVHPLWKLEPYQAKDADRFDAYRNRMAEAIEERMSPRSENEASLFIPLATKKEIQGLLGENLRLTKEFPQHQQWPDLFKRMKRKTAFKRNLVLGPDVIEKPDSKSIPISSLLAKLEKRGFKVGPNTRVVVGGEMLFPCVAEAALGLISLDSLDKIEVDKRSVITSDYLLNPEPVEGEHYNHFKKWLEERGLSVKEEGDYLVVSSS